ncbi:helix-turn-helix domain containing protein [Agrococcus sp. SL85]|uniref:TetR/AcrR family transcriptional regulator n=1 Tax=Agrococcus sp. SL85 TaxID=2995141 RepID=UPI00226D117F|nr:TetR/AcrR family transcriptional regulator [Agrococcus sp. SL85]WAC65374.1 helix-turn-helix domain containing protein [Agrococcus sp. SL85]
MARVGSGNAREQLLDAYEALLIEEGERAATVQAVAARAGVSKGGLLYHFGSKAELETGLIERFRVLAEQDVEALRGADDIVGTFLRTSVAEGSGFDRATVAIVRLAQLPSGGAARAAMQAVDDAYAAALSAALGDEEIAHAIVLMSDGVYLRSALGALEPGRAEAEVERLIAVARRLGA